MYCTILFTMCSGIYIPVQMFGSKEHHFFSLRGVNFFVYSIYQSTLYLANPARCRKVFAHELLYLMFMVQILK